MKKKIIIFRASGPVSNIYLHQKLSHLNYSLVSFPILKVNKIYKDSILINSNDLVLTTSFYGVFYLSKLTQERNMSLFILGKSSNYLAKNLGFKNIIECAGDSVSMLVKLVDNKDKFFKRNMGDIIYAGAKNISFNLPAEIEKLGYNVKRYKIYSSEAVNSFTKDFILWVKRKEVSWVVLLSVKGARTFYNNSKKYLSEKDISNLKFACISENVAKKLNKPYFKKFFPTSPNTDYIREVIFKYERDNGT